MSGIGADVAGIDERTGCVIGVGVEVISSVAVVIVGWLA